jgi:hypothetical protein
MGIARADQISAARPNSSILSIVLRVMLLSGRPEPGASDPLGPGLFAAGLAPVSTSWTGSMQVVDTGGARPGLKGKSGLFGEWRSCAGCRQDAEADSPIHWLARGAPVRGPPRCQ